MTYIVDIDNPPPLYGGGVYWERGEDPWHGDAFKKGFFNKAKSILLLGSPGISKGKRKAGWMLIDFAENPIGFIPDGSMVEQAKSTWVFAIGPCKHLCAFTDQKTCDERTTKQK